MAERIPGSRDFDSTEDEEPHSHQSMAELMEVIGKELDNQQVVPNAEAHVLTPKRESSQGKTERAIAALNPTANTAD